MPHIRPHLVNEESDCRENRKDKKHKHHLQKNPKLRAMLDGAYASEDSFGDYEDSENDRPAFNLYERIPMEYWEVGWVLKEIADADWYMFTKDSENVFPRSFRYDEGHYGHPGYVLKEEGDFYIDICPLSTCESLNAPLKYKYISDTDILEATGYGWSKKSFVVERSSSRVPRSYRLFKCIPQFLGVFPPHKLNQPD